MCKLGVEEWLCQYQWLCLCTQVQKQFSTVSDNSKCFEVKVDMYQGSASSPLLLVIVMVAISREFRVALPWELLYGDE